MKKPFNKTKVGNFLTNKRGGKMLVGALDTFTGGLASNVIEKTDTTESGQVDWTKLLGLIITALVMIAVLLGKISPEEAQQLVP